MSYPSKKQVLKRHPLFESLSWWNFGSLADRTRFRDVPRGELVVEEGDPGEAFFLVTSGRCEAFTTTEDGRRRVLEHYTSGDSFGELALLSGASYWASVRALNDTLLLTLVRDDFEDVLQEHPDVGRQLSRNIAERVHLRRDHRRRRRLSKVITVGSASENIGRSLFGFNTAAVLREETGEDVCLLDFTDEPEETVRDVPEDPDRLADWVDEFMLEHACGIHFMHARLPEEGSEDLPGDLLDVLVKRYNYVFFVLPEGLTPVTHEFYRQADRVFLLANRVERNVYQTHLLNKQLMNDRSPKDPAPQVVLARLSDRDLNHTSRDVGEQIDAEVVGRLPELPGVSGIVGSRDLPYALRHPDRPYSRVVRHIARRIGEVAVGLALGSGSARGLAHIGVLRVLEEEDILVDVVAGTSIGALIGAGWSSGLDIDQMERFALDFRDRGGLWTWSDLSFPPTRSIFRDGRLRRIFQEWLGDATFADTRRPLKIMATDLDRLEPEILDEGSLVEAVLASIAIPMLFPPVSRDGRRYVDGAVLSPIPVDALWGSGVGRVIAVNPIPPVEVLRETRGAYSSPIGWGAARAARWAVRQVLPFGDGNIVDVLMRSMQVMQSRLAESAESGADVVLNPVIGTESSFDFDDTRRFIHHGEITARENLDAIRSLVDPAEEPPGGRDEAPEAG